MVNVLTKTARIAFNNGLISENAENRLDLALHQSSMTQCKNFLPLMSGPLVKRPGFWHAIDLPKDEVVTYEDSGTATPDYITNAFVRGIPFEFSDVNTDNYLLLFCWNDTEDRVELLIYNQTTSITGVDVSLETAIRYDVDGNDLPYGDRDGTITNANAIIDLTNLRYRQKGDVVYLVDGGRHQMRTLTRSGESGAYVWTFSATTQFKESPDETSGSLTYSFTKNSNISGWGTRISPRDRSEMDYGMDPEESGRPNWEEGNHSNYVNPTLYPEANGFAFTWESSGFEYDGFKFPAYLDFDGDGEISSDSDDPEQRYSLKISGELIMDSSNEGMFRFAINTHASADVKINDRVIYGKYGETLDMAPFEGGAQEMYEFTDIPGAETPSASPTSTADGDIGVELSANRTNFFDFRYMADAETNQGVSVAWRRELTNSFDKSKRVTKLYEGGAPSGCLIVRDEDSGGDDNLIWQGAFLYKVIIEIVNSGTQFTVKVEAIDDMLSGTLRQDVGSAGVIDVTAGTPINISSHTSQATEKIIEISRVQDSRLFLNTQDLCSIWFDTSLSISNGTVSFMLGYERMKTDAFTDVNEPVKQLNETSFPRTIEFFQGRLALGGRNDWPFRLNLSRSHQYLNFSLGALDSHGVETDIIDGGKLNKIEWLASFRQLFIGTTGGIHSFPSKNDIVTPSNDESIREMSYGCGFVEPVISDEHVIFADKSRTQLSGLIRSVGSQSGEVGFTLADISSAVNNIFSADRVEFLTSQKGSLASYTGEEQDIVWIITENDNIVSLSLRSSQEFLAWATHEIGGDPDATYNFVSLPDVDGDRLYGIFKRGERITVEYIWERSFADSAAAVTLLSAAEPGDVITMPDHLAVPGAKIAGWSQPITGSGAEIVILDDVIPMFDSYVELNDDGDLVMPDKTGKIWEKYTGSSDLWAFNTYTSNFGFWYESIMAPLAPEFEIQGGTTHGLSRSWGESSIHLYKSSGRINYSFTDDRRSTPRSVPIHIPYKTHETEHHFTPLGITRSGQIRYNHVSAGPMKILVLEGMLNYAR